MALCLDELPTPCLVIDDAIVSRNLSRLATYARDRGFTVRPHTKTHKSLEMSRRQLAAGASGLTVAKAGEAIVMSQASSDILLAYPTIDRARCTAIAGLAKQHTLRVAVDSADAVLAISAAAREAGSQVGVMVDLDVGMHRTGLQTPAEALELARLIDSTPNVRLDGLFIYPGQIWAPAEEQAAPLATISALLDETLDLWSHSGLAAPIVSGGSTPTLYQSHHLRRLTELRPGTYIFNDMNTVRGGYCSLDDCAARIVCTVITNAVPGKVVVDAGTKTLTSDRNAPRPDSGHGHVVEYPNAVVTRLSEEHGEIDITACDHAPKLGQRVSIIPNHICPCINLQDTVWLIHSTGDVHPLPIDARGRLS